MRILLIALVACASGQKQGPDAAATTVAASMPSNAAPEPAATPEKAKPPVAPAPTGAPAAAEPAPHGPMTAAEAAAATRESDDAPCSSIDDCAFTMTAAGACCPMLCTPRPVTKAAAAALQAHERACAEGHPCPHPSCAPPRFQLTLVCESGKCVAKRADPRQAQ